MDLQEFIDKGHYLPAFLKKKTDQDNWFNVLENTGRKQQLTGFGGAYYVSVSEIQSYIMDYFLPLMAKSGYTLQVSRFKNENMDRALQEGLYLPLFLQDFHDQKDLFKFINTKIPDNTLSFVKAQVYTIDVFLYYCMAAGNYKLQKVRRNYDFENIVDDAYTYHIEQRKSHLQIIKELMSSGN